MKKYIFKILEIRLTEDKVTRAPESIWCFLLDAVLIDLFHHRYRNAISIVTFSFDNNKNNHSQCNKCWYPNSNGGDDLWWKSTVVIILNCWCAFSTSYIPNGICICWNMVLTHSSISNGKTKFHKYWFYSLNWTGTVDNKMSFIVVFHHCMSLLSESRPYEW